ncbi:MAG: hypothetical protein H6909_05055 [Rickettsiaceae bacterium]|nr:hypothetical protein [Rickettsiaceae bacterium]
MQRIISKLDFFINLFNNILHNKNIMVFVGHEGITITALKKLVTIEEIYLPYEVNNFTEQYQKFLEKYKNFYTAFLVDTKTSKINRHVLPIVSSIVKLNPVDKFIKENYDPNDLVAYNIYNITNRESEIWNTLIAATKYESPLTELVEYVIQFHKYRGIYLFALESSALIQKILLLTKNEQYQYHFQIFVTILRPNLIKIIIKRRNNILYDLSFPTKLDRSDEFLKGTIEQLITDQVLECKEYITRHSSEICIILLVNNRLKNIIEVDENFCKPHHVITLTPNQLQLQIPINDDYFQESVILNLSTKFSSHLAYNTQLKQYNKCNFINKLLFKPILILIIYLFIKLLVLHYDITQEKSAIYDINNEYYDIAKTYRAIITQYPKSYDLNNLIDLYTIRQLLNQKLIVPDNFIQAFFALENSKSYIRNFSLETSYLDHANLNNNQSKIIMEVTYIVDSKSNVELMNLIDTDLKSLKDTFSEQQITYELESNEGYKVSDTYIEPVKFILTQYPKK